MTKQTAVEWLVKQLFEQGYFDSNKPLSITNLDHLQHQALQMEKEQKFNQFDIQQAYRAGYRNAEEYIKGDLRYFISSEQYYTETYGKETDRNADPH